MPDIQLAFSDLGSRRKKAFRVVGFKYWLKRADEIAECRNRTPIATIDWHIRGGKNNALTEQSFTGLITFRKIYSD